MLGPTPRKKRYPDLEIEQILAWADAHFARTREWPSAKRDGRIPEAPREKWANVDAALRYGLRGLQPGSSLARLLARYRGVRNRKDLPSLTEAQILAWADAYFARHGRWPTGDSGRVEGAEETWTAVDVALTKGLRGLPGGSSLAQLLAEHRQRRNKRDLPPVSEAQILTWADAHHARTGEWPSAASGAVAEAPGETWNALDRALRNGCRGFPGGSSLARLLERERGIPNRLNQPRLTVDLVLAWADAHRARTGRWPVRRSGAVAEAPEERWSAIDACLQQGSRGLPGGTSLHQLLAEYRGARKQGKPVRALQVAQILAWADAHYAATRRWPTRESGSIAGAPGETWCGINVALQHGHRGLPGRSSLSRLLARYRGARNRGDLPPLTETQILAWADAYHACTGRWPTTAGGAIEDSEGETWISVDKALRKGTRGLRGGSSLAKLLVEQRGKKAKSRRPPLTVAQILTWADAHHCFTGEWPTWKSGAVADAPGETWSAIHSSLTHGYRDLPGGSTLTRLLAEHRGVRNVQYLPQLTEPQVMGWADAYRARRGRWPSGASGPVEEAPGETWAGVDSALRNGCRGFPGGSSLSRLIREHRRV